MEQVSRKGRAQRSGYPRRPARGAKDGILTVNKDSRERKITRKVGRPSDDEDTVTLKVKIAGKEISAVLDTGAKTISDRSQNTSTVGSQWF